MLKFYFGLMGCDVLHIILMMEIAGSSETSENLYQPAILLLKWILRKQLFDHKTSFMWNQWRNLVNTIVRCRLLSSGEFLTT
jgi:hypothetical protein